MFMNFRGTECINWVEITFTIKMLSKKYEQHQMLPLDIRWIHPYLYFTYSTQDYLVNLEKIPA